MSHEEYAEKLELGEFFLSSGDGPEVKKEYGNFYGILESDYKSSFEESDRIMLFISYRDIENLYKIKKNDNELCVQILNLTFTDLDTCIAERLKTRGTYSTAEVIKRIENAKELNHKYKKALDRLVDVTIYTDLYSIEKTYKQAVEQLKIKENGGYNEYR